MNFYSAKEENSLLKAYNMLLYFAGSMIMYEPDEECVVDFWSKGILKALPVRSNNPRFMKAASQLRESCRDKTVCREILQEDFRRLFSTSGVPHAAPLKSEYSGHSGLDGSEEEKVSDFYSTYGWHKRSKYDFADDNLGLELLFLTILIDKYMTLDDKICHQEMGNEIMRFVRVHILSWLPIWYDRMQEYADTLCYKGIATLIFACCEDIYNLLEESDPDRNKYRIEFRN